MGEQLITLLNTGVILQYYNSSYNTNSMPTYWRDRLMGE